MEYLRETKGITQSLPNGLVREFFVIENIWRLFRGQPRSYKGTI
jgi:hypothetical protein